MSIDSARIRGQYPTLGAGTVYLEGSYAALQPESVIRAITTALRAAPAQPGSRSARSQRGGVIVAQARDAVGDLLGVPGDCVAFGGNVATLLGRLSTALARDWQLGDQIVLSRMDHEANQRPWLAAARGAGAIVDWVEVDPATGNLPLPRYEQLLGSNTRVVTVPLANPTTGQLPDLRAIADQAHAVGALVVLDAGAAIPHLPIDLMTNGADLVVVSANRFGGPTVAALVARPGLLAQIEDMAGAGCVESGSLPVELLPGVTAAVEHLAGLDEVAVGTRRQRLISSIRASGARQSLLFSALSAPLRTMPAVTVLGGAGDRVPVAAFAVRGCRADEVADFLLERGITVWTGPTGMDGLISALTRGGVSAADVVHIGLMPHSSTSDVDRFASAMRELTASV
ncbi:MAG: aminotransferase class V-fold PLP-dependent enzyme [Actinomycetia bacterium]|nr:aminotransferase class V-fold PLP-dependent enzyme [Actinomycetes bacterium]